MPKKYHITPKPTPPRFPPVGKYSTVDWSEDCIGCQKCVKKVACVYDTYNKNTSFIQKMQTVEYLYICKNCLRCVQECTKGLLTMSINPEYRKLGDSYWTPDIILSTWYQAETGKIPVSGAGYRGPFSGPGFDSMWTDMSEIVRPTRDGIHGREYISTTTDLGRKLDVLEFDENGALISYAPSLVSIPLPLIFNLLPFGDLSESVLLGMAQSAAEVDTIMQIIAEDYFDALSPYLDRLMPVFTKESFSKYANLIENVRIAEFIYTDGIMEYVRQAKKLNPEIIISIRLPLAPSAELIVEELAEKGAEVIHLCASSNGTVEAESFPSDPSPTEPRFIKDVIRDINQHLVENYVRD
jgi:ferredoxin